MLNFFRRIKERRLNKQKVGEMYREVVKSFPGLKEDEIKIRYLSYWNIIAGYDPLNRIRTKKDPKICIGYIFFGYTKEVQEGIIAHEIGHHETVKNWTIPRLKRSYEWNGMYKRQTFPNSRPHWEQRIRQRHILNEMAANNKVAETKYGKELLEYYKSINNKLIKPLVRNLEERLAERNE